MLFFNFSPKRFLCSWYLWIFTQKMMNIPIIFFFSTKNEIKFKNNKNKFKQLYAKIMKIFNNLKNLKLKSIFWKNTKILVFRCNPANCLCISPYKKNTFHRIILAVFSPIKLYFWLIILNTEKSTFAKAYRIIIISKYSTLNLYDLKKLFRSFGMQNRTVDDFYPQMWCYFNF